MTRYMRNAFWFYYVGVMNVAYFAIATDHLPVLTVILGQIALALILYPVVSALRRTLKF